MADAACPCHYLDLATACSPAPDLSIAGLCRRPFLEENLTVENGQNHRDVELRPL
jgi:hypothetical protein